MTDTVLRCDGVVRRFGERVAVNGISFHISRGETYGLLGPNGAGKTTTISMVAGILAADDGSVTVGGVPVTTRAGSAKRAIGLVPQDVALYPDLTLAENLRFFGRLQGMAADRLRRRIDEVVGVVGLGDRIGDRIETYSGGMKRRANVAAGLLHEPELLILDEPTVGVDPQSRIQILESVEALGSEGLSVLYTTHYMEEAERLCARVGIIDEGRLVAEGTRRQLVDQVGQQDRLDVGATGDLADLAARLQHVEGVGEAAVVGERVQILATDAAKALTGVVEAAGAAGTAITSVQVQEPDLEDVFLHLTGKALRD